MPVTESNPSAAGSPKSSPTNENLLLNLACNVILPGLVLSKLSQPQRLAMTSIAWTPGSVALGWSCVAGKRYRIQVSENLSDWTTVRLGDDPLVVLGSASGTASVDVPSGTSLTDRRYYRVEVVSP
jgi:hypothetical protein